MNACVAHLETYARGLYGWLTSINPVSFSEAVRQVLYVGLAFELLQYKGQPWTEAQIAIVLGASSALLSLLTRSSTVSNLRVEQKVSEQVAHRELMGQTGTGNGLTTTTHPTPPLPRPPLD